MGHVAAVSVVVFAVFQTVAPHFGVLVVDGVDKGEDDRNDDDHHRHKACDEGKVVLCNRNNNKETGDKLIRQHLLTMSRWNYKLPCLFLHALRKIDSVAFIYFYLRYNNAFNVIIMLSILHFRSICNIERKKNILYTSLMDKSRNMHYRRHIWPPITMHYVGMNITFTYDVKLD